MDIKLGNIGPVKNPMDIKAKDIYIYIYIYNLVNHLDMTKNKKNKKNVNYLLSLIQYLLIQSEPSCHKVPSVSTA
jgi:hypothetical protein